MHSSGLSDSKAHKIIDYVNKLPDGNSVCHGDFYLGNIIDTGNNLVTIDWSNGYRGDPSSDVAETCLTINSPAVPPGTPDILAVMSKYPKRMTYKLYINEYMRLSGISQESIEAWMMPVAAVRLKDKIPGEEKWLMKIIDKKLERLDI